ncbi:MAG TPA: hypothetical protein VEI26_05065 [Terriglobales bacterium]|nr:hypothetical protein [Terriglobales bacterium]
MQQIKALEKSVIWVPLIILIFVASSALIRFVTSPTPPGAQIAAKQQKLDSAQDKMFRSIFESGSKSFQDGQYTQALEQYAEAGKVVPQLREDEYTALKNARQQIAEIYENGARRAEAETLYKGMIESAFRDAAAQLKASDLEAALERYQDAAKLADHLSDAQKVYRISATKGEIATLRRMNRFPDALQASQHLIDYLQASDQGDPDIVQAYMSMGETYQIQRDWAHLEATLPTSIAICDRILQQNSGVPTNRDPVWKVTASEDQILYALMEAYDHDGKPDQALATAQTLYDFIAKYSTQWLELGPHGRKDVAKYAFLIATRAGRPDAASTWQARINEAH